MRKLILLGAAAYVAFTAVGAEAQIIQNYGCNPAATLGSAGNFANGYWFVGYSPQDHPAGGAGSPKYDAYNYLILNGVNPADLWAPAAAAGLNVTWPGLFWAYDGQTLMYGDEYVHSAPAQYGVPGASAASGPMAEFFWGSRDPVPLPDPNNAGQQIPAGRLPSGAVSPPGPSGCAAETPNSPWIPPTSSGSPSPSPTPEGTTAPPPPAQSSNPTIPPDAINLNAVKILNAPNVANWPVTAQLTTVDMQPQGTSVFFTKRDGPGAWPNVPFGAPLVNGQGGIEYSLWVVENIGGQWYASAGQLYWQQTVLTATGGSTPMYLGGSPATMCANEFYDPNRWGPMAGVNPPAGTQVGFFVTSGVARNNSGPFGPSERSNVVLMPYPSGSGATSTFAPASAAGSQLKSGSSKAAQKIKH
jgi:hypothetical protein